MSTNLEIIEDALREINVISENQTASPEQGKKSLRKLNQLMEMWKEESLDLQYFAQTKTTDVCPIPDWAELAVSTALGIYLAPGFSVPVPPDLPGIAGSAVKTVRTRLMAEELDNTDMSHMPRGTGHYGSGYDITTDL